MRLMVRLKLDGWVRALRLKAHALAEEGGRRHAEGTKPARRSEGRRDVPAGEAGYDRRRA